MLSTYCDQFSLSTITPTKTYILYKIHFTKQETEAYITEGHTAVGGKADVCPTPGSFKDSCSLFHWGPLLSLTLTLNLRILMVENSEDSNRIPPISCPQSPQYE